MPKRPFLRWLLVGLAIALLIGANFVIRWPHGKTSSDKGSFPPGPPPDIAGNSPNSSASPSGSPDTMRERFQAALQALPADQRKTIETRLAADRSFFDSVRNLPETERQEKIQQHFAQNPPPQIPGLAPLSPDGTTAPGSPEGPGGGPGGPGHGPESGHIPPPSVRRSMDQHIVDSQKTASSSTP